MSDVLIFSGTTEGRKLSELLARNAVACDVCVATEYGEAVMEPSEYIHVHRGRLDEQGMRKLFDKTGCRVVVDATHPYADIVTKTVKKALRCTGIEYIRLERKRSMSSGNSVYSSVEECAKALSLTQGNVLLTTGSKELSHFCCYKELKDRLYARVIPSIESLSICYENGLSGRQITAAQGPFTEETNIAAIRQYDIKHIVLKESGTVGGEDAKLAAAIKTGITAHIIKRPESKADDTVTGCGQQADIYDSTDKVFDMKKAVERLSDILGVSIKKAPQKVFLIGTGCGDQKLLTCQAMELIMSSDYIFGAKRMTGLASKLNPSAKMYDLYRASDIIPVIDEIKKSSSGDINISVLFSGDISFFSGASELYRKLKAIPDTEAVMVPGISSMSLFFARLGMAYQDADIISTHGVSPDIWRTELEHKVKEGRKVFFITSGAADIRTLGSMILGLSDSWSFKKMPHIYLGFNLSYEDEKVWEASPAECAVTEEKGLYVVLILPA